MTELEFKNQQTERDNKVAALESKNAELEAKLAGKESEINALDESVKELKKMQDELVVKLASANAPKDFKSWLRGVFEENKAALEKHWNEGSEKADPKDHCFKFGVKTNPAAIGSSNVSPNNWFGVDIDPTIYSARTPANAFVAAFGQRPCVGSKLSWMEGVGNAANAVGYTDELAQNTNLIDFNFSEKNRSYGKLTAKLQMSTEFEDWYEALYDWCVNEGQKLIEAKFDYELFNGNGDNDSHPTHIYGLKGFATAFSALAAGKVDYANEADVLNDAQMQIAKEGFNANVAIVSWKEYAVISELKDKNGHNLFHEDSQMLRGLRIIPSTHIADGEMLIADNSVVAVYGGGNSYELEIKRNADYDRNDVYFRKRCQVKIPATSKKALVYVASVATAIAALQRSQSTSNDTI